MNADILAPVAASIIEARLPKHAPPSAVFAVSEGGKSYVSAAGIADLDLGSASTRDHSFDLASVSKLLTTLALARMVAAGDLDTGDRIGHILGSRAGVHAEVTIDQLLRHRAGLAEWHPVYLLPNVHEDPVRATLSVAPRYKRDSGHHYSDLGFQILGDIVSHVSGVRFDETVRQLVLKPLRARTVTAFRSGDGAPAAAGPDGDAIEREMVRSGIPYPVDADEKGFPWRLDTLRGTIADGNAFHAFGAAAGHAGWFSDAAGALAIAAALGNPERIGATSAATVAMAAEIDPGQGAGTRTYRLRWRGVERLFLGHPGFTGTFIAASPATDSEPEVLAVMLSNRLHGRPAPSRHDLSPVEDRWRDAMVLADRILNQPTMGERP